MARRLNPQQLAELSAFVRALLAESGFGGWAEFARVAGVPAPNLSKLQNGLSGIDGYNLLRLIKAAAANAEETDVAAAVRAARRDPEQAALLRAAVALLQRLAADPGDSDATQEHDKAT